MGAAPSCFPPFPPPFLPHDSLPPPPPDAPHPPCPQVLEFVAFKERLDASHSRAVCRAEQALADARQAALDGASALTTALTAALTASPQLLPGSETPALVAPRGGRVLRFNQDLSTLPAWYPPHTASPPHLAPAAWWGARGDVSGQGYGRRWWAQSGAAEVGVPEAAQMRDALSASVSLRWLTPHIILGSLAAVGAGATEGVFPLSLLPLPDAVATLGRVCGASAPSSSSSSCGEGGAEAELDAWVQRAAQAASSSPTCSASTAEAMASVVLAAVAATSSALGGAVSPTTPPTQQQAAERAVARLGAVQGMVGAVSGQVGAALSVQSPLLDAAALALASTLVQEQLAWLVCMLEVGGRVWSCSNRKRVAGEGGGREEKGSVQGSLD